MLGILRFKLFQIAQSISSNVVLFLPRNVDLDQLSELSWLASPPLPCEVSIKHGNFEIEAFYGIHVDLCILWQVYSATMEKSGILDLVANFSYACIGF